MGDSYVGLLAITGLMSSLALLLVVIAVVGFLGGFREMDPTTEDEVVVLSVRRKAEKESRT